MSESRWRVHFRSGGRENYCRTVFWSGYQTTDWTLVTCKRCIYKRGKS